MTARQSSRRGKLGRNVQVRIVLLGLAGRTGLVQQTINLPLQFQLRLLHALIAHRLVTRCIGLDLSAVYRGDPQFGQPTRFSQLHYLNE